MLACRLRVPKGESVELEEQTLDAGFALACVHVAEGARLVLRRCVVRGAALVALLCEGEVELEECRVEGETQVTGARASLFASGSRFQGELLVTLLGCVHLRADCTLEAKATIFQGSFEARQCVVECPTRQQQLEVTWSNFTSGSS